MNGPIIEIHDINGKKALVKRGSEYGYAGVEWIRDDVYYKIDQSNLTKGASDELLANVLELARGLDAALVLPPEKPKDPCSGENFEWDDKVLNQVLDYVLSNVRFNGTAASPQDRTLAMVLRQLYKNRAALGLQHKLRPVEVVRCIKALPYLAAIAEGIEPAAAGDFKKLGEIGAKLAAGEFLTKKALIPAPLVGAMFVAADIARLSEEELQRQEQLLDFDLGFYDFFDDAELQQTLDTDPKAAVRTYVTRRLVGSAMHRRALQAYIDLQLPAGKRITLDDWRYNLPADFMKGYFDSQLTLKILAETNEGRKLRTVVLGMLREMELKRERMLPPDRQTRLRNRMKRILAAPEWGEWEHLFRGVASDRVFLDPICEIYMHFIREGGPPE